MIEWEIVRHQVAIAGRVTDFQTGKAIAQAQVQIVEGPDRTRTAADGHFHFLDLPDGQYTLIASLPGSGSRYGTAQAEATVSRDAEDNITMATADIALPPTTLKGQITDQATGNPVVMVQVQVQGSGERTFSDAQGRYILTGLEAGKRTVLVSARGYQPGSKTVLLSEPGTEQTLDFVLEK